MLISRIKVVEFLPLEDAAVEFVGFEAWKMKTDSL
jgi:hypothetical protein